MATNQQYIDRALTELGMVEAGAAANSTDSTDALDVFNAMMAALEVSDMDLNWFPQDTLGDTPPIPVWAEQAIISMLAVKCSTVFRSQVTQDLFSKAAEGENLIGRTLMNHNLKRADMSHLPQGRDIKYNIITDDG